MEQKQYKTEAEYFAQVMQPQGWGKHITGGYYYDYEEDDDGTVMIDEDAGVFLATEVPSVTRSLNKLLSVALDHYEALQTIRKYEQS